jgi:deoxyribodipyrimidine photo-lyase
LYTRQELDESKTHDDLCTKPATIGYKMHGFLKMYWAKQIFERTKSPEDALSDAIYLNDRYSLDDPESYVGFM